MKCRKTMCFTASDKIGSINSAVALVWSQPFFGISLFYERHWCGKYLAPVGKLWHFMTIRSNLLCILSIDVQVLKLFFLYKSNCIQLLIWIVNHFLCSNTFLFLLFNQIICLNNIHENIVVDSCIYKLY